MIQPLLFSIHDRDAFPALPSGGWCVDSIALSENPQAPDYQAMRSDINWIVRLNHAHNGVSGTIPHPSEYDAFAKRCADFVSAQRGAVSFIIGNEPNHRQEYVNGQKITPESYGDCFNRCYQVIKAAVPTALVGPAAVAPWNGTTPTDFGIDWLEYARRLYARINQADEIHLHATTHGAAPDLIWSQNVVNGWFWHFPILYQQIASLPTKFSNLPVHCTETNQGDDGWVDTNSGWVQNAYQSVDNHNKEAGSQKIRSLALYRWRGDKWQLHDKPQVMADFYDAVQRGYRSPLAGGSQNIPAIAPLPPPPTPPAPNTAPPVGAQPTPSTPQLVRPQWPTQPTSREREIDPHLLARGVHFEYAKVAAGQPYWRITEAQWHPHAASTVGPDHHILGNVIRDKVRWRRVAEVVDGATSGDRCQLSSIRL